MVRLTDRLDLTVVVDSDVKPQIRSNKQTNALCFISYIDPDEMWQKEASDQGLHCIKYSNFLHTK